MPGTGESASSSHAIGLSDWVDAVVDRIDAAPSPVVLVGHSGGAHVAWGAADARPGRVARVILVDAAVPFEGSSISEFPVVDGVVPFPGWEHFDDADVVDLDPSTRSRAGESTAPVPARVPSDRLMLHDDARFGVPVTVLAGDADADAFITMLAEWPAAAAEFARVTDAEIVRIGSGHWPQFSQPERLAELIAAAVDRRG
jgi:pimeloyl-ACP methyl ester carboxylesterase